MRAKTVKFIEENQGEIIINPNDSVEELIDIIQNADLMLKNRIEPLLRPKEEYKKARKKALVILKRKYQLSREDIKNRLNENKINETFDVLTWSRKYLSEEIADEIEEIQEGGYGEKLQKSLLKIGGKEDLIDWVNKNFEFGRK